MTRRRSNSALPPSAERHPERALDEVEDFYRVRDLPVLVQVSPAERHTTLDAALDARGYRRDAPTLVLTAPVDRVIAATARPHAIAVDIFEHATPSWRRAFGHLDGHDDSAAVAERVLAHIPAPAAYASVTLDGETAGIGLFAAAAGWVGIFCMATYPQRRREGIATAVLHAGARWAAGHRAAHAYLQVEQGNSRARQLYGRVGFARSHSYHYRVADQPRT